MPKLNKYPCAGPNCDKVIFIPDDEDDLRPYADAAGWSVILAGDEVHLACCDEHALAWVEANRERLAKLFGGQQ